MLLAVVGVPRSTVGLLSFLGLWFMLEDLLSPCFLLQLQAFASGQMINHRLRNLSTQRFMDSGVKYTPLDCEECAMEIDEQDLTSCQDCDAGPFHRVCKPRHQCAGVARLGMVGGLGALQPQAHTPVAQSDPFGATPEFKVWCRAKIGRGALSSRARLPWDLQNRR